MKLYLWDIETSCVKCDNGEEIQVTYLSNVLDFDLATGNFISKFFRTIEETREYFKTLEEGIIYVHNLDYELTFLLRDFEAVKIAKRLNKEGSNIIDIYGKEVYNCIFRDKNSPLSIVFEDFPQLTFKDSYALFNKSVKQLGEDLIKRGMNLPKLDYDYKKIRLPWDKLEEKDYKYNQRDNEIVGYSIYLYMRDNNIQNIENLPLTFTSAIRMKRKEFILENYGKKELNNYKYEQLKQVKDYDFFNLCKAVYQGGLTTSNILQTNKFIPYNVYSIDIKSSYPFQMVSKKFPQFHQEYTSHYKGNKANEIFDLKTTRYYVGIFTFYNIRVKNEKYLLPISTSQFISWNDSVKEQGIKTFNGKLISADVLNLPCNNLDVETIKLVYDYDYIYCNEIYVTYKQRFLRESETSFLLNLFTIKESQQKDSIEYVQAKQGINGQYGIKVTSPIKSNFQFDEGLNDIKEIDYYSIREEEIKREVYDNFVSRETLNNANLDIYTDGLYITSYARLMLVSKIVELINMGCTVVYSDTDSIKFYTDNIELIKKHIEEGNKKQIIRNKESLRFAQYKERFNIEDKIYNKICKLGIWEMENFDNPCTNFITFGAKKYGYIDNEGIHITISGCNKKKPIQAIMNRNKLLNETLEQTFKSILQPNTRFSVGVSGRTTSTKEKRRKESLYHMTYEGKRINQYGGIIIKDTTYTLNLSLKDSLLLGLKWTSDVSLTLLENGEVE